MKTILMPWQGRNAAIIERQQQMRNMRLPGQESPPKLPPRDQVAELARAKRRASLCLINRQLLVLLEHLARGGQPLPRNGSLAESLGSEARLIERALYSLRTTGHIDYAGRVGQPDQRVIWLIDAGVELRSERAPPDMTASQN